jgi:hypothetical protein
VYDYSLAAVTANQGAIIPQTSITQVNSGISNNLGTTIQFRQWTNLVHPDLITITWPVSQILGVYKVTVFSNFGITDGSIYNAWLPLNPANFGTLPDATLWGCPFLPVRNASGVAQTKPNVNLTTGQPILAIDTYAGMGNLALTSIEVSTTSFNQTQSVTYFAINSPTTTIAKLTLGLFACSSNVPLTNVSTSYNTASTHRIMIEQVNAEISN